MESEEIFAELLRTSPPDPFAVRHTRPRRPTRMRPHQRSRVRIQEAIALVVSILFFIASTLGLVYGQSALSLLPLGVSSGILGVTYGVIYKRRAPRCSRCHQLTFESKSTLWCWKCSALLRPEKLTAELEAWLRSHDLRALMTGGDSTVRMMGFIFGIMLRDEMNELLFLPSEEDYRMVVNRDGKDFEFEPPSPEMHREIAVAVRAMWHGDPGDVAAYDAVQTIHYEELYAAVQLTITPTPAGDSLRFQFSYPDDNSVDSPIPQPTAMV